MIPFVVQKSALKSAIGLILADHRQALPFSDICKCFLANPKVENLCMNARMDLKAERISRK